MKHAFQQNPDDPRAVGKGPCGLFHGELVPITIQEELHTMKWMSNGWARWADCSTCALRLLYFPKHGHIGKFRKQESPPHVDRALHMLRERGLFHGCNHAIMKTLLDLAAAEMKATGKETSTFPGDHVVNASASSKPNTSTVPGDQMVHTSASSKPNTSTVTGDHMVNASASKEQPRPPPSQTKDTILGDRQLRRASPEAPAKTDGDAGQQHADAEVPTWSTSDDEDKTDDGEEYIILQLQALKEIAGWQQKPES